MKKLFLVLLLGSSSSWALDPDKSVTQYVLESWLTKNGLPQNSVSAICQTPDGYLWIGTQEGLVRFDGVRFTVFDRSNSPMKNNTVLSMALAKGGGLWIGTNGGGLAKYENGNFSFYTKENGLGDNRIYSVFENSQGEVWIGAGNELSRLVDTSFTTYKIGSAILSILEARDGTMWFGARSGLFKMSEGKLQSYTESNGLPSKIIYSLFEDSEGFFWIGTSKGLARKFDNKFVAQKDSLADQAIRAIYQDRDKNLWFGTNGGGLYRYTRGRFTKLTSTDGLPGDQIRIITEDREGSLWIGINAGGLNRLKDGKFTTFTTKDGLSGNSIWAVFQDRLNHLWIGTNGKGLNEMRFDSGRYSFNITQSKNGLSGDFIWALFDDRQDRMWVGTSTDGLSVWNHPLDKKKKKPEIRSYKGLKELGSNSIMSILEDREGRMWVGTNGGGLNHVIPGEKNKAPKINSYRTAQGLTNNSVTSIFEDRAGNLWAGTRAGLNRMTNGQFKSYTVKDSIGMTSDAIWCFYQDSEENIWIGTDGGGLLRMTNGKFSAITTKDGLVNDIVFQILEDARGNLWMSCNKGVFRVPKKDLNDYIAGKIARVACTTYGVSDGMRSEECNGGIQPAGYRTRDGRLWFPTIDGLAMIDPEKILVNNEAPPVLIEKLIVDNEAVKLDSVISLAPGKERLEIQYAGLSLYAPEKVKFKYKLDGFDREWQDAGTRRTAYYTNLAPRDYQFRVIACNNDGVWNEAGAILNFTQRPYFYQTLWFLILSILSAIGIIVGYYFFRVRQLRARAEHLELVVKRRTKELAAEKDRSESLLLNILPQAIADRLKRDTSVIADSFPSVSILFADIVGFTKMSAKTAPQALVVMLNEIFSEFDRLAEKYQVEKIKTIGDNYMVGSGLPIAREDHAIAIANMGLDMIDVLDRFNENKQLGLQIRIGINSGPAVAGVIGKKKFIYDVWGDSVNIASRMESHGTPGRIHISQDTYDLIQNDFLCERRGTVEVKGKGQMTTFFLVGRL